MEETKSSKQPDKHKYTFTFNYIKDAKSPNEYLSTLPSKGILFEESKVTPREGNYPFEDLCKIFETSAVVRASAGDVETTILQSWCKWTQGNEEFGWISIKPHHLPYLEDNIKSVTKIKDAEFSFGSFNSPTGFCRHFKQLSCSVSFEYDMNFLSISHLLESNMVLRFDISSKTFTNSVIISNKENEVSIYIETNERFKMSISNGGKAPERFNLFNKNKLLTNFGLSSVLQISFSNSTFDTFLEIISYLKRKGISVMYADVNLSESCYSLDELNQEVQFSVFETQYAWQCLVHRGYKVIDSISSSIIEALQNHADSHLGFQFCEMESRVDDNIFFDFEKIWKETGMPKEENDEENHSSTLYIRRIVVTPTSEIYFRKEPTKQNRVTLKYDVDYFIRVVFRDEDFRKLQLMSKAPEESIIDRVKNFLRNGIHIGDRHFKFLGCSNSQMREHGAWFVAEHDGYTADSIRKSLGDFSKERCVASYVSRLGLCFSSSCKALDVDRFELEPDIERKGYCFTDGIGKLSESLAIRISKELGVAQPSAFQIRYAGCKGVIALDPSLGEGERLVFRNSMLKFDSPSKSLEILQWTRPGQLFLNRQIITLMSGLGVPDEAFLSLQQKMLLDLATMLIDEERAFEEISSVLKTINYKCLKQNGVILTKEPFFRSILVTILKFRIDGILKKSRIAIPWQNGRIMMGTVDETGTLKYGEVFISYTKNPDATKRKTIVHTGTVVVAKNPCFHPGDLRKFDAVDKPRLHHMVDCIVFPQNGDRPHPDEMSGSDLDGDMYFVCWDESLIPPGENRGAMKFPKSAKKNLNREIRKDDVIEFLGDYIKNDRLGLIANAHVVHADKDSIHCEACIELAKMHSDAVDFPKTGNIPELSKDLTVDKYPDFMMKKDKVNYNSKKILGQLFRQCEFIAKNINQSRYCESITENATVNHDFLQQEYERFLPQAKASFKVYRQKVSDLMNQYGINTEAELFSGMILSMKTQRGCLENETFELRELLQTKISKVCKDTRIEFFKEFGGEQNAKANLKFVCAKASAWYIASYGLQNQDRRVLSFPWLFGELVVSKKKQDQTESLVHNAFADIGSSVEKRVRQTLSRRHDKFDDLMRCIKNMSRTNPSLKTLPLIGVIPLCLLSHDQHIITFYNEDGSRCDEIATHQQYGIKTETTADCDILRKTVFIKDLLEQDSKLFFILSYLLDWVRDCNLVGPSENDIFNEIDFAYLSACLLKIDTPFPIPRGRNLSFEALKWIRNIRLSSEDLQALGRDTLRFLGECLDHVTLHTNVIQNSVGNLDTGIRNFVTEEILVAFLELSLNYTLESLEDDDYMEHTFVLPYGVWNNFQFAKQFIAQQMKEKTKAFVEIRDSDGVLVTLFAGGTYDQIKQIRKLVEQTSRNSSQFINTPARDMLVIKNSFIFVFEGCSGKDDMVEYIPYYGEHNSHHTKYARTIPSLQRISKHATDFDCELFTDACLKQINTAAQGYDHLFHGDISMRIVLGRIYLMNAPKGGTSISAFEEKIIALTKENEMHMKTGQARGHKGRKIQQKQARLMRKSFIPITYDVLKSFEILLMNNFVLQREEKSYKVNFFLEKPEFGKHQQCLVSLDENLALKYVSFQGLAWVVADVIRDKSQSSSISDVRFKIASFRSLKKECIKRMEGLKELAVEGTKILVKTSENCVEVNERFKNRIPYVKEKTVYSFCQQNPEDRNVDVLISSIVEYTNLDKSGKAFQNVAKRNEISMIPTLPDLSRRDDWYLLLQHLWNFSLSLSTILDTM